MDSNGYPFFISELSLPELIEYEFRTIDNVLYSCFFTLNPIVISQNKNTVMLNVYEFGLTDVIEKIELRKVDYKIKQTVALIILDFLIKQRDKFCVSIHYSNADKKAEKRIKVFNKWFEDYHYLAPFEMHNKVIEIDEHLFYESIIIHTNHTFKTQIIEDFNTSY